jgi:hypothetical protein
VHTYIFRSLEDESWVNLDVGQTSESHSLQSQLDAPSDSLSMHDVQSVVTTDGRIVLPAGREVRMKLFMGGVRFPY